MPVPKGTTPSSISCMPSIERTYRIRAEKHYRALAGLSMGGYGSMIYALKYPELFAAAAPLSAAIRDDVTMTTMPDEQYDRTFAQLYGRGLKSRDRLNKAWYANSPLKLVEERSTDALRQVRYWIDCGDDDWRTGITDALAFIGVSFHQ